MSYYKFTTPKPVFVEIRQLIEYLEWHDLDCTKSSFELMQRLSEEFNAVVSMRNLVMAALLSGYAVIPSPSLAKHFTFCRVSNP